MSKIILDSSLCEEIEAIESVDNWMKSNGHESLISSEYLPFLLKNSADQISTIFLLGPLVDPDPLEISVLANFVENGGVLVIARDQENNGASIFEGSFRIEFKQRRFFNRYVNIEADTNHPFFEGIKEIRAKRSIIKDTFEYSENLLQNFCKISTMKKGLVITFGDVYVINLLGESIKKGLFRQKSDERKPLEEFKPMLFENLMNFINQWKEKVSV